jgi:hypothetical protein
MSLIEQFADEDPVIDVDNQAAIRFWRTQFNCTENLLRNAVERAGRSAYSVEKYLQSHCHEEAY